MELGGFWSPSEWSSWGPLSSKLGTPTCDSWEADFVHHLLTLC